MIQYRQANQNDVQAIAALRSLTWGTEDYWLERIAMYMDGRSIPQKALKPQIVYIATVDENAVGFIAGHLTHRYDCEGELQWIDVLPEQRKNGIATRLLKLLAAWFVEHQACKVCVDVDPTNTIARHFYSKNRAKILNPHWMIWNKINNFLDT